MLIYSQAFGVSCAGPRVGFNVLMGPFQLSRFHGSMNVVFQGELASVNRPYDLQL